MSPRTRAVIVEDEVPARRFLASLLAVRDDIECVGEAGNGEEAVELIRRLEPQLVFLDVQLPGLDGFQVLNQLGGVLPAAVIFVTAYDEYALEAFGVHAVDYLLKPFDAERLDRAIQHASHWIHGGASGDTGVRMDEVIRLLHGIRGSLDRLPVRSDGKVRFVELHEIHWIEAAGKHVRVHAGQTHEMRIGLTDLEKRLPGDRFIRIHRSAIVNVSRIKEVEPWFQGALRILLHDGTRLTSGAAFRGNLDRLLNLP